MSRFPTIPPAEAWDGKKKLFHKIILHMLAYVGFFFVPLPPIFQKGISLCAGVAGG